MAFRSPENVQRNELVRFQLGSNIKAPANAHFLNGIMLIFKLDLKADGGNITNAKNTTLLMDLILLLNTWWLEVQEKSSMTLIIFT